MTIDEVIAMWIIDAPLNELDLQRSIYDIPKMLSKYLKLLARSRKQRILLQRKRKLLQIKLMEYYSGDLNNPKDLEEIKRQPFEKSILNSQIKDYIEADKEMIDLNLSNGYNNELIAILEDIMKSLHNRNFLIKNSIDYQKFISGSQY